MAEGTDLVLTTNRVTASGHHYDDRTGVSYEYPPRYRRMIVTGRRFVYYRGRDEGFDPHYFGSGIIGDIRDSQNPGLLVCDILDYHPFARAVPFTDGVGHHLEPGGDTRGYYQPGCRRVPQSAFEQVIELGSGEAPASPPEGLPPTQLARLSRRPRHAQYAPSEASKAVEERAVVRATEWLAARYPACAVEVMPRNNPGFDIRVVAPSGEVVRYVEVKGTAAGMPSFFISDGERRFSTLEAARFTLVVVWAVNLVTGDCEITSHDGAVEAPDIDLTPRQFQGLIRNPSPEVSV